MNRPALCPVVLQIKNAATEKQKFELIKTFWQQFTGRELDIPTFEPKVTGECSIIVLPADIAMVEAGVIW